MQSGDPYDLSVAFDDVYGELYDTSSVDGVARMTDAVMARVRRRRFNTPPMIVGCVGHDLTRRSFALPEMRREVLGDSAGRFPMFDRLRSSFSETIPEPKAVRLDTEDSYAAFRSARRDPYIAELEARIAAVEEAVSRHVADDHGGGRVQALEEAFQRHVGQSVLGFVDSALTQAVCGGTRVPLFLPHWAEGKIDCWQDGSEVLCTVRLPGPDGRVRLATTGSDVGRFVDEVVGCAAVAGAEVDDVATYGPVLAQVLAGESLIPQLCRAAPDLLSTRASHAGEVLVGALFSTSDPDISAVMSLLQRCQRGDRRARAELDAMCRSGMEDLVANALERLLEGQRQKAQNR